MPGHFGSHTGGKKEKTGGGGGSNRPNPHTDSGLSPRTNVSKAAMDRNKKAMEKAAKDRDRDKLTNYKVGKVPGVGPIPFILNAGQKIRQKTFEKNLDFYRNKVLTSKNRGNYEDTFTSYSDYMKSRLAGNIDAYGNPLKGGGGGDDNYTLLTQEPTAGIVTKDGLVGPIVGSNAVKTPEQIKAEQEQKNKEGGIILAKKRGRSEMIKTSSTGLMDEDDIIMRKTLLG